MTGVHQLVPTISPRDAVGNHTLALREVIRELGFDSEIFSMFRQRTRKERLKLRDFLVAFLMISHQYRSLRTGTVY